MRLYLGDLASFKDGRLGEVAQAAIGHDLRSWRGPLSRVEPRMVTIVGTPPVIIILVMQPASRHT